MINMYEATWNAISNINLSDMEYIILMFELTIILGLFFLKSFGNPMSFFYEKKLWLIFFLAFVLIGAFFSKELIIPPQVKNGMASFELARNKENAQTIINMWIERDLIETVKQEVLIDYLFIVSYVGFISLVIFRISEQFHSQIAQGLGATLGWGVVIAGQLDAFENLALIDMLSFGASNEIALLAFWAALFKFVILLYLAVPFILIFGTPNIIESLINYIKKQGTIKQVR